MGEDKKQEPLNEYFLKAILSEKEIPVSDISLTTRLNKMTEFAKPELKMDEKNNFSLAYEVDYNVIKNKIIAEEQAYELRTHGWILNEDETKVVLNLK